MITMKTDFEYMLPKGFKFKKLPRNHVADIESVMPEDRKLYKDVYPNRFFISELYNVHGMKDTFKCINVHHDTHPNDIIPFGGDGCGNHVCARFHVDGVIIKFKDVVIWSHDTGDEGRIIRVADNFDDFWKKVSIYEA